MFDSDDFFFASPESPTKKQRKSLNQLRERQLKTQTDDIRKKLKIMPQGTTNSFKSCLRCF